MARVVNIFLGVVLGFIFFLPVLIISLIVRVTSFGPAIFWSSRVGKENKIFKMPKFRTMKIGTPTVATHLLKAPEKHLTKIGKYLRKTSVDELPQIWSIIKGDMVFVGPRPALHNQHDLIAMRTKLGIHHLIPGITGWAQIQGRDELSIDEKVKLDEFYLINRSTSLDLKILARTVRTILKWEQVSH